MNPEAWEKYQSYLKKRIEKLADNNFYLEIIFLLSGLLERELKDLITIYEKLISKFISQNKIQFLPEQVIDKENLPLGKLKQYFSVYSTNKTIIKEIESFNELRKKVIHKIFDENIENLETKIKNYIPKFYKLMYELSELEISLLKKENILLKREILLRKTLLK